MIPSSEDHLANDHVIRQHGDDELTIEQVGDIGRRHDVQGFQLSLFRPTNVADHAPAGGRKISRHRRSHPTKADESHLTGVYRAPAPTRALARIGIRNPGQE